MPNTDHHQVLPDFFPTKEKGKKAIRENTNPRYKFFKQTHFTAGDYEQFIEHWDTQSHRAQEKEKTKAAAVEIAPLFKNLTTDDVMRTFEYIFHKFKKGIYVKIVDNELRVFLPFSKIDYTNEWSDRIRVDPKKYPKGVFSMFEASTVAAGYTYDPSKVHFMTDHWYANNGLLRYEYPISESDSGIPTLRDMLVCLVREREVPDVEFFINKRDFPILRRDGMEAYECMFGEKTPLVSHRYDRYAPIVGMTTTTDHADIPIPTWEDWARVSSPEKCFGKEFASYPDPFVPDYRSKTPTAIFRGSSTGLGTTTANNPRLFFSMLSQEGCRDETDGELFLDCGITKWNCRPRRAPGSSYYDIIDPEIMAALPLASFMEYTEQATYKFILHLPGHSEAYRLSTELGMNSVILLYPCRYKLWYMDRLKPYEHYVPLTGTKADLWAKIRWCKAHEDECEMIAANARNFYEKELARDGILNHIVRVLDAIATTSGPLTYARRNMLQFQDEMEKDTLRIESGVLRHQSTSFMGDLDSFDLRAMHPRTFQVLLQKLDPTLFEKKLNEAPVLKQSRSMILKKIEIAGRPLCIKTPIRASDSLLNHECFVGQIGLNRVANVLPMVVFTYGRWGDHIVTDFIEGETMEQTILSLPKERVLSFFLSMLQQLSLLLHYLQHEYGFLHLDLYPWNIMVQKNTERRAFEIPVENTRGCRFIPEYYPVLIDFGKSHILYQNCHFVRVSPFRIHLHHDVLSILISGLYTVVHHHKLGCHDISTVLRLMNYVGGTSYTGFRMFDHMGQLKAFLKWKKKFSNMLVDDKEEFRHQPPLAFFSYLTKSGLVPPMSNRPCDLITSIEVYYSRFHVFHEMHSFLGVEMDVACAIMEDRGHKTISNAMNRLYRDYMDYRIMGAVGGNTMELMACMKKSAALPWTEVVEPSLPEDHASLPRFMTHPNILESRPSKKISNHFFEKHKILSILLRATYLHGFMEPLRARIEAIGYYREGILGRNRAISISNHLCRYREWEQQK